MTTDIGDVPLLNMASVMLTALKAAGAGEAGPADCLARLARNLAQVHEDAAALRPRLESMVEEAFAELLAAGLLAEGTGGRFRLTPRGRTVLEQHPLGVDESVLAEFREFRDFVRRASRPAEPSETPALDAADNQAYLEGYGAYGAGRRAAENPHPADTAEHVAWDAGWFEALDEALERPPGGAAPRGG
jgi:hypothetical protein